MTDTQALIERLNDRLGGVTSPLMEGDNISILLCSHFDDPDADEQDHDDCGWSEAATTGCDQVLNAIREHYAPLTTALTDAEAKLAKARDGLEKIAGTRTVKFDGSEPFSNIEIARACLAELGEE